MRHYLISWEIDIWADSAHEAAMQAHKLVRSHDTTAKVYKIIDGNSGTEPLIVDLRNY